MLTLLVATNNTSGCESKHWLLKRHVVFQERNMLKQPLNVNEIKELLSLREWMLGYCLKPG
ncbi:MULTISPECIES: hypothetical protein [Lentilactobacillus]|uniref:Transposase n=1 Tax=Lentilactobacillus diolivorans TaxID=179838 RepID=A0ABQ0XHD1_9LACO|nr:MULTISPECIES: hypothetical protein [Lentilactobacillus]GEP25360.1 hypothetical protein LDI01_29530 [Lentilactobacillus diolivorans]